MKFSREVLMFRRRRVISRRDFLKLTATALGGAALACGKSKEVLPSVTSNQEQTSVPPTAHQPPTVATSPTPPSLSSGQALPPASSPTPAGPRSRVITANDFVPEQTNYIDTLVVAVNYSTRRDQVFDFRPEWDKVFGTMDPIRQLNAYYNENFYGQLQLRPVEVPPNGYLEVELEGTPQDYTFGWLVGMETEDIAAVDPDEAERLVLEVMAKVVEKYPDLDYQDKFIFIALNALGSEYGRGAAGALPTGGADPVYDLFIGKLDPAEWEKFSNLEYFRIVGDKVVGIVRKTGYVYDDYFRDRGEAAFDDQFIMGIALFGKDAPLSCASHDILHGLRRRSAYADPPEGRSRAANCLYNLPLQSQWVVGTEAHGNFDRSVNVSPYIGWWDPMGDHLHPNVGVSRTFFSGHPHGMCAFTKLRMTLIPERCIAVAEQDDVSIKLTTLSQPRLPPPGAAAEAMVVKVPLMPSNPNIAHIYLLLEYRSRFGTGEHPDNFSIAPDFVCGNVAFDPGYNQADPAASRYINPPTQFVSKEGVLVYLVNEKMSDLPILTYKPEEWYAFVLLLLNPAGNEKRADLTQAALAAGESIVVDCRTLYSGASAPVKITVMTKNITSDYAEVQVIREYT
jgi:hypothetical protein